jgi:hypothetical protein
MNMSVKPWIACALVALAACNDSTHSGIPDLKGEPAFAVQRSNFMGSAAVALLDGEGALLNESYISTATEPPGLNTALAGDIALPTTPCDPEQNLLTVVARQGGDYVLQVDLGDDKKAVRQIKTQGKGTGTAFDLNPQDILCLSDGRALVTRLGLNSEAKKGDVDRGDDIAVLDLDKEKILSRVDLSRYDGSTKVIGASGTTTETTYASPGSIVRVGDHQALVGLSRLTADFSANPQGEVLLLDLDDLSTSAVELDGLANCGSVFSVPDRDDAAVVQCAGAPYGSADNSGLALISVDGSKATIEQLYKAEKDGHPIVSSPTPIGGTRVIAAYTAADYSKPDQVYLLDLETGKSKKLFTTKAAGDLGSGAVRLDKELVLIADAGVGVRVFKLEGDDVVEQKSIELSAAIPARTVRPLVQF